MYVNAREALQQGDGDGVGGHQLGHSTGQQALQESRGGGVEALIQSLRSDGCAQASRGLGHSFQCGLGVGQPGEDNGLGKDGAGEFGGTPDESGLPGQLLGGGGEEGL